MEEEHLRKMAIEQFLKGKSPISIYGDLGRSKPWFYKWLHRYQSGQDEWFKDESKAPHHPNKTPEDTQKMVTNIRLQLEEHPFAQIGVSAIQWELRKLGVSPPPDWTINRILKREGLVKKNSLYPQGGGISLLPRTPGDQQHPSSRSSGPPVYQGRRAFLFASYYGPLQPSGLYPPPAPQRRRFGRDCCVAGKRWVSPIFSNSTTRSLSGEAIAILAPSASSFDSVYPWESK